MEVQKTLRTIDLARAVGISVQQVRNYEAMGLLPEATRSKSGYRHYTPRHLAALQMARNLIAGYGWQRVPTIMKALHRGDLAAALTIIDARHAELAQKRIQVEQTLDALRAMTGTTLARQSSDHSRPVRVGDAAKMLGVRVSALYFWEERGLLHPVREKGSRYRLYDEQQMRRLRVVVLLRESNYDFTVIEAVLDELTAGRPEKAIVAVEKRREDLTRVSWLCLDALSGFQQYVHTFCSDQIPFRNEPEQPSTWMLPQEI